MLKNNINYTSNDNNYGISPLRKDKDDINDENKKYFISLIWGNINYVIIIISKNI